MLTEFFVLNQVTKYFFYTTLFANIWKYANLTLLVNIRKYR